MNRRTSPDRGSLTAFVAVLATALVMVAGMAYDGGNVLTAHATARSYASKAARAGGQQIDTDKLRQTGQVVLEPAAAHAAAQSYLAKVGANGTVTVEGETVTVTVTIVQPMQILPLPDRTVAATDAATATEEATP
jgi:hypothetical protein